MVRLFATICILTAAAIPLHRCAGQMIQTTAPLNGWSTGFSETSAVGGSVRGQNWFMDFVGGAPLLPPFGGVPGAGSTFGAGFRGGGVTGNIGLHLAQSSSRSMTSVSPSITTMNGVPGTFSSTVVRPFVTGFVPIFGGYPAIEDPGAIASQLGGQQLAALRQSQADLEKKKLQTYLRRAQRAARDGNKRMARANFRGAIAIAREPLRTQLILQLRQVMMAKELPVQQAKQPE